MANILFRVSSTAPIPASTTVKNAPLTNIEVDGNFKSLNDAIINIETGVVKVSSAASADSVDGKSFGNFPSAGGILYTTSTSEAASTNAGTAGQFLKSNGSSAPSWTNLSESDIPALNASKIATGTISTERLGSGTPSSTTFLRGDNTWSSVIEVSDDTSTNATYYPTFTASSSGALTDAKVSSTKLTFNPSTGTLTAVDINALSDATLKNNVSQIKNASEIVANLNGVTFEWKENGKASSGVIAQDLEKVLPDLVSTNEEGIKSVNYSGIIAYLIESNKELQKRIEALESSK